MSHLLDVEGSNLSKYKIIKHGSDVEQLTLNGWTDLTGSTISFKPSSNANYVIYEYNFYIERDTDTSGSMDNVYIGLKLLQSTDGGSSWSDYGNNTHACYGAYHYSIYQSGLCTYKVCLTSWGNSERYFKLQGDRQHVSYYHRLHTISDFIKEDGSTEDRCYRPIVSCYQVTH